MKKQFLIAAIICFVLFGLTLNYGWGATVYINNVAGTVYYESGASSCGDITAADTAGDLQDAITASGALGITYVCSNLTETELDADSKIGFSNSGQSLIGVGTVVLDGNGVPAQVIYTDNIDGITISNIGVTGATAEGITFRNANNLIIDSCIVYRNSTVGIFIYARDQNITGLQITNNTVYENGGADISSHHNIFLSSIVNGGNWDITSPVITGNTVYGAVNVGYTGIKLKGGPTGADTGTITGAIVSDNEVYGMEYGGIDLSGDVDDSTVSDNYIHDLEWFGIGIQGDTAPTDSDSNVLENNIITTVAIRGVDGAGILFDSLSGTDNIARYNIITDAAESGFKIRSAGQSVYYNIIKGSGESGVEISAPITGNCSDAYNNTIYGLFSIAGIYITSTCTGAVGDIENNIVVDSGASPTGIRIESTADSFVENYNLVYGFTNNCDDETPGGGSCGANDVNGDPLLTNSGAGDFTLQLTSPAINAGTLLSIHVDGWTDYAGITRLYGGAPEIGAYETIQSKGTYPLLFPFGHFPWGSVPYYLPWYVAP